MKIISDFHDYYDGCMSLGIDPKCIYIRKSKLFREDEKWPVDIEAYSPQGRWGHRPFYRPYGAIWFCNKIYPYIVFELEDKATGINIEIFCYDIGQVEHLISGMSKKDAESFRSTKPGSRYDRKRHRSKMDIFEDLLKNGKVAYAQEKIIDILCETGVPVLRIHESGNDGFHNIVEGENVRGKSLTFNPKLTAIQFYRAVDPFTAWQELSMFISGVMGGQAPPMIEISDRIRKEKHGFNEDSFRNTGNRMK